MSTEKKTLVEEPTNEDSRVWLFFVLIFSSWLLWIPAGARAAGVLPFPWPFEIAFLGAFAPLILSIIFIARWQGLRGLSAFFARFVRWRFGALYWLYALFAMPLAALATAFVLSIINDTNLFTDGIVRLFNGEAMAAIAERNRANVYESMGLFTAFHEWQAISAWTFGLGYLGLVLFEGGVSEEPGWRAFAYPVLRDRWAALPAALVVGAVWAAWHIGPQQWKILFADGLPAFLAFLPGHLILYVVGVLPLAIIFSWLYDSTRGSLLACFVVHASFNMISTLTNNMFEGPVILGIILLLWVTVIVILITRGWRSFAPRDEAQGIAEDDHRKA
ncbi:MAG: CPBP family intramembrane metalloprotease [Parvularculaceae bacterium]|nr:CPBP family intramembrane metalloprotease [Parvularculaceae bacterium]